MNKGSNQVKRCYPFFWKECGECQLFFKLEIGYKVTRDMFGHSKDKYLCSSCAPTIFVAHRVVKDWAYDTWVGVDVAKPGTKDYSAEFEWPELSGNALKNQ